MEGAERSAHGRPREPKTPPPTGKQGRSDECSSHFGEAAPPSGYSRRRATVPAPGATEHLPGVGGSGAPENTRLRIAEALRRRDSRFLCARLFVSFLSKIVPVVVGRRGSLGKRTPVARKEFSVSFVSRSFAERRFWEGAKTARPSPRSEQTKIARTMASQIGGSIYRFFYGSHFIFVVDSNKILFYL